MAQLRLLLARHGEAEPGHTVPDGQRALTGRGRRHVRQVGRALAEHLGPVEVVITSPLVRAVQTAELLAGAMALDEPISARGLVAEPPSLAALAGLVDDLPPGTRSALVVGHQPTLGAFAAHLLGIDHLPAPVRPGTVIALDLDLVTGRAAFVCAIAGAPPVRVDELAP